MRDARIGSSAEVAALRNPKYNKDISVKLEDLPENSSAGPASPTVSPSPSPSPSLVTPTSNKVEVPNQKADIPRKKSSPVGSKRSASVPRASPIQSAPSSPAPASLKAPSSTTATNEGAKTTSIPASPVKVSSTSKSEGASPRSAGGVALGTNTKSTALVEVTLGKELLPKPQSTSPTASRENKSGLEYELSSGGAAISGVGERARKGRQFSGSYEYASAMTGEEALTGPSACLGRHIARRLVEVGVRDVFTVPGDFNLILLDHLIAEPALTNIGCCNEINAGYAADGYARCRGVGACVVTFTVGGLSVINAIAGSYSENLPIICIVGGPNTNDFGTNRILHHTIGIPDFSQEVRCFQQVTCYQANNSLPPSFFTCMHAHFALVKLVSRSTFLQ